MLAMAPILLPRIIDGGRPNEDATGITYVALSIIYTIMLSAELYLLFLHREVFCVQIRNVKAVFTAVTMLHGYLVIVLLVYPLNGRWPCSAEYWVMSLFLPLGMAFFQACNARVLTAYESQRRLQRNFLEGARKERHSRTPRGLFKAWLSLDAALKVYYGTIVGVIISIVPAFVLFLLSRRFHANFGVFGPRVDAVQCRRGPEWIPSILVQLFWSTLVGPWILWKIRKVNDVHGWAWQTRLAIMAGFPGTPLWMTFTFSNLPAFDAINKYFPPAGWFLPSLVVCQQALIIIPLYEAYKSPSRRSSVSSTTATESLTLEKSSESTKPPRMVLSKKVKVKASMQALEFSLETDIESLILWAASREFTAENTIFLREVRNFKKKWAGVKTVTTAQRRQMFTEASLIFFTLVNPFTAEVPINIEYKVFRVMQQVFADVEYDPYLPNEPGSAAFPSPSSRDNVICPWENVLDRPASFGSLDSASSGSSVSSPKNFVPSDFTEDIFDAAFESIKYLVFTNTWPRYVEAELMKGPLKSP